MANLHKIPDKNLSIKHLAKNPNPGIVSFIIEKFGKSNIKFKDIAHSPHVEMFIELYGININSEGAGIFYANPQSKKYIDTVELTSPDDVYGLFENPHALPIIETIVQKRRRLLAQINTLGPKIKKLNKYSDEYDYDPGQFIKSGFNQEEIDIAVTSTCIRNQKEALFKYYSDIRFEYRRFDGEILLQSLSRNPGAIDFLTKNPGLIDHYHLFRNPEAKDLILASNIVRETMEYMNGPTRIRNVG